MCQHTHHTYEPNIFTDKASSENLTDYQCLFCIAYWIHPFENNLSWIWSGSLPMMQFCVVRSSCPGGGGGGFVRRRWRGMGRYWEGDIRLIDTCESIGGACLGIFIQFFPPTNSLTCLEIFSSTHGWHVVPKIAKCFESCLEDEWTTVWTDVMYNFALIWFTWTKSSHFRSSSVQAAGSKFLLTQLPQGYLFEDFEAREVGGKFK